VFVRSVVAMSLVMLVGTAVPAQRPSRTGAEPARAPAVPSGARTPRNASYAISARLDPASRTLTGDELLTWRNTSRNPSPTLQFHLYYNAWRNSRSTWMRERAVRDASMAGRPERDWGWIDLTSLRVIPRGGTPVDMMPRAKFVAPDDGNADDRTVLEVPLDKPVAPGETVNVQIAWSSRVPRTFARTGVIGDFYFLAQWFPKIGVLADSGWNTHQFHSGTEFFADFGSYDVRLTVPRGWVVGATGGERDRRDEADGTTTHHYTEDDVHDFAWTTSPHLLERHARFEHPGLPAVDLRLLLQPEHSAQAERHFAAARATLKSYGEWFGPYPYAQLTIVDPAWQSGAEGMEYPTLITAGSRWLIRRDVIVPEGVVVHEAGHQFWYGLVASNEFENAWMDEGFNTFATARVIEQSFEPHYYSRRYFGDTVPWVFHDFPLSRVIEGDRASRYRVGATSDAQATPTWRYWPGTADAISYAKTALWLHTLERRLGWPVLQRILATYFSRWEFRHPTPDDFFAIVSEVTGQDYTWFFDEVYRGSESFDYGVQSFRSEPDVARGFFGDAGARAFSNAEGSKQDYRTTVVARRIGGGVFPVDVRVVFQNKEEIVWHWDGRDRWKSFEIVKRSRAVSVQIDPEHVLLLDVNYTNNSATLAPRGAAAARKWSLAWLVWFQDHLLTYGFFV
jgi:hypothetical protein